MDIEQLSKSQIVLLTLLVSFVTSIATGIVTVSLMDQAPPAIAQTVNRVIERTVETVAPANPKGQAAAATIVTQEKTVVVKEADQISQAVQRITPSVVRLYTSDTESPVFLGLGIVLDNRGTILADSSVLDNPDTTIALSDGTRVRAFVTKRDKASGLAFLTPATSTAAAPPVWVPAKIASDHAVLGGSVVALSGKAISRIAPGLITAMPTEDVIDTNIESDVILGGSPIINTDGNVVGVSTSVSRASSASGFMSATAILAAAKK